jgi:L-ribulokinase
MERSATVARLTLGLDYGTNSVRGLVVNTENGEELASAVFDYPSGEVGVLLDPKDPHLARQNPRDYIDGFVAVCQELGKTVDLTQVVGIGVDTTGSSPMPIDANGESLAANPNFAQNLAAYCWLWKDHTGHAEAAEITQKAANQPYLAKCGGTYSSEWWWSKILKCARVAPDVFAAAYSWAEICDWIPAVITGTQKPDQMARSRCAAGHKAMFADDWSGLPSKEFLATLDPRLADLRDRLYNQTQTSDKVAGLLTAEFAENTGLPVEIPVAVGAFDAHFGAVGSAAGKGTLVKIMGTSTCDCMVYPLTEPLADVPGLCGIVNGSILPGYYGLEAGQSAVGDIFNWVSRLTGKDHEALTEGADKLKPGQSGLVALDWNNGNRTILVDPRLSGLLVGQTLYTTPAEVYRAAIESTAYGALRIIERFEEYGVKVERVVACGGISVKNPMAMQIYADIFGRPVSVAKSDQTCALGSAIFAAVAADVYPNAEAAQAKMAGLRAQVYKPIAENHAVYKRLYALYRDLHDAFGTTTWTGNLAHVMKDLMTIREGAHE